jgi:cytochrome c556
MNMDDQFLHQLRRDPSAGFATRLKWQLDRPARSRPSGARLLLVFAIFGTAFALVAPPARRALVNLFNQSPVDSQPGPQTRDLPQRPPASVPGMYREAESARGPASPRDGAPVAHAAAPPAEPMPPLGAADAQPAAPDDAPVAAPAVRSHFVITSVANAPLGNSAPPTPQQAAAAAVATRQGLFKVLGAIVSPLALMRQQHMPVNMEAVGIGAKRLAELSPLILEVFGKDTRPFAVETRALDSIWMQPEDFEAKSVELTLAADALDRAVASNDDGAALKAIYRIQTACSGCHDVYRRN